MLRNDAILTQASTTYVSASDLVKTPHPKPIGEYTPDKSQKRNLSLESTPSPSSVIPQDKKHRIDPSFVFDAEDMEPEVTLAAIMAQLKLTGKVSDLDDVAKKKDLMELQGIVSSHTLELEQLRDDITSQAKRIQELETTVGQQTASMLNRTSPDVDTTRFTQHGGPHASYNSVNPRRKNLVFEGLPSMSDRETISYVIQLCAAIDIIAYQVDFEAVVPMRRRDGSSRPAPILITFTQYHLRWQLCEIRRL